NATPDQVKSAAVGLLVALRVDVTRWVLNNGILGREGYRLDTADPRFTTELLAGPLDPSNDAFGGGAVGGGIPRDPEWLRDSQRHRVGPDPHRAAGGGPGIRAHDASRGLPDGPEFTHARLDPRRREPVGQPAARAVRVQRFSL